MGLERWRTESPTVETLTCGCKILWHPDSHIPPGLLRCARHQSVSVLLAACKALLLADAHANQDDYPIEVTLQEVDAAYKLMHAAIAKAEPKEAPDA